MDPPSLSLFTSTKYDPFLRNQGWNNDPDGKPSAFMLLKFHVDRLLDAADKHCWYSAKSSVSYATLLKVCHNAVHSYPSTEHMKAFKAGPFLFISAFSSSHPIVQIRINLTMSGSLTAVATPADPFTSDPTAASFFNPDTDNPSMFGHEVVKVYLDLAPTRASIFTRTKTTDRSVYNQARSRCGIPPVLPTVGSSFDPLVSDVLMYNTNGLLTETSICNIAIYRKPYWITPAASTGCLPGVFRRWLLEQGRIREDKHNSLTKECAKEGDWVLMCNGVKGCRLGRIVKAKT